MKKVLIARNSADGVVASLLIQARFETCDPLFGGRADIYEELGVPLYSAGIKCRKCELYIDDAIKNLAESAWDVCPNDRYRSLVTACSEEDFLCFFDLYGASSCFGQLRCDPDSWRDENLQAYRKMQEETASRVLLSASGGKVEVFSLPETAGRLCRKLVFFENRRRSRPFFERKPLLAQVQARVRKSLHPENLSSRSASRRYRDFVRDRIRSGCERSSCRQ